MGSKAELLFGENADGTIRVSWRGPEQGIVEVSDVMRPDFIRAMRDRAMPWLMEEIVADPLHERSFWRRRADD